MPPDPPDSLEIEGSFQPQVVVYLTDPALSDELSATLGERGHKTVQVEDLPTAYAVVTKLAPGALVADPSLTLKQNLRDLELLRKFTREQDCALIVLVGATRIELVDRLAKMRVDDVCQVTDPLHLLVYRIERIVNLRQAKENLGREIP
jgi:DNA-binding NtrC family response regulator